MSNNPKIVENISEDGVTFYTVSGKVLCHVSRDEDSYEAAVKVFSALNIDIMEQE